MKHFIVTALLLICSSRIYAASTAATEYTLSGMSGKLPATLGPKTSATSLSVTRASDEPALTVTMGGKAYATSARNDYTSTAVDTSTWVQLIASTAAAVTCIEVFDSCGQTLQLGTGAAASETRKLIIPPGGLSGCVPLAIPAGTRVSVKAISATCSVGELDITGFN